jgi:hypothetical protein
LYQFTFLAVAVLSLNVVGEGMTDYETAAVAPLSLADESGAVMLELSDLLPDAGGEIVVHATGVGTIGISTGQSVTASGTAEMHVTAAGEDVSGFRYYQLAGGITLYCQTNLLLGPDAV